MRNLSLLLLLGLFEVVFAQEPGGQQLPPVPDPSQHMEKPSPPVAETFTYDPTGKRDPFEPDLGKEQEVRALPQELQRPEASSRALESLEAFDLTQLRVAAIIWDTKIPRAMVIDPSGGTHYIKAKSRIGRKNGFVAAIREGEIVVIEYNQENGQYTKVFKVLELR